MSDQPNVKIWIGNIDIKLTEFQLLKIVEKFGKIASYDFLYNINDRGGRTPRGYAFVTYETAADAATAIQQLHKKKLLNREVLVRYASAKGDPAQKITARLIPAALKAGTSSSSISSLSDDEKQRKIRALEAKLKLMESTSGQNGEFKVKATIGPRPSRTSVKPY